MTVTIEQLRHAGKALEIGCYRCKLHIYVDPAAIPVPNGTPVPGVSDLLRCPQCASVNAEPGFPIWTRPDARPPKMGAG